MTANASTLTTAPSTDEDVDLFHFRRHANLDGIDEGALVLMDTVAELARDNVMYKHVFAMEHGCDLFDIGMIADWAAEEGLVTAQIVEAIKANRTPFLTAAEVSKRLEIADGSCPLCGTTPSFSALGAHKEGCYTRSGHCGHFGYDNIHDLSFLRTAPAWQGARWPYILGEKVAGDDGYPLRRESRTLKYCCTGCRTTSVYEVIGNRVGAVLLDMVAAGRDQKYWSRDNCPTFGGAGGLDPEAKQSVGEEILSERTLANVRSWVRQILERGHNEFRLNGCGLKLYTRGIQEHGGWRTTVTFDMFVGGDPWEREMFKAFVTRANDLIRSEKLRNLYAAGSTLECQGD
jgi:hypothetical protein